MILDYLERCYEKDPSIVHRNIAGEAILVPIRRNVADLESIYTLDEVAARIWELIDGQRRVEEIRDAIVEEYEVSLDVAEVDLVEFIQQLEAIGGVRRV
jgi:hypothetical protein